jgi:hypothetical protein
MAVRDLSYIVKPNDTQRKPTGNTEITQRVDASVPPVTIVKNRQLKR